MPVNANQTIRRSQPASRGLGALNGAVARRWEGPPNLGLPIRAKETATTASAIPIAMTNTTLWAGVNPSIRRTGQRCQIFGRRKSARSNGSVRLNRGTPGVGRAASLVWPV